MTVGRAALEKQVAVQSVYRAIKNGWISAISRYDKILVIVDQQFHDWQPRKRFARSIPSAPAIPPRGK